MTRGQARDHSGKFSSENFRNSWKDYSLKLVFFPYPTCYEKLNKTIKVKKKMNSRALMKFSEHLF